MRILSLRTAKSPRHLRIGLLLLLGGLLVASCGDTSAPGGGGELDASALPEAGEGPRDASVETGKDGATDGPRDAKAEGGDGGGGDAGDAGLDGGPACSTVLALPRPPPIIPVSGDVAVGDLDGDGLPDLAVGSTVMLNRGRGVFAPPRFNTAPAGSLFVSLGDVDGDGDLDMVTTAPDTPGSPWGPGSIGTTVSVFLNDGTGTFGLPATYPIGANPGRVALGDLNGDGRLDLVSTSSSNTVNVLFNTGAGAFGPKTAYATGASPGGAAVGDFDGDGDTDIAVPAAGGVSVFLNDGLGTFAARVDHATSSGGIKAADVNGDGKVDLVVQRSGSVSVLMNAPGGFAPEVTYPTGAGGGLSVADLNGDGKADLAVAGGLMMNNGDGTFAPQVAYGILSAMGVGDFDGDGRLDVVSASDGADGLQVFWNNPGATFATTVGPYPARGDYHPAGWAPKGVAVADLDGDGDADLAIADIGNGPNGRSAYVALNNGDGTYAPTVELVLGEVGRMPRSIAAGDVDGDGDVDLASVGSGSVSILANNGAGTFGAGVDYPIDSQWDGVGSIALGDINGDGRLDLAISLPGGVNVLMNNGTGTFAAKVNHAAPPGTIALQDLNGDRKPDIAVAGAGGVTVLLNTGTGTFGAPLLYPTTTRNSIVFGSNTYLAVGDVDGDGDLDLAAEGNGSADVLLNYGNGTFAPYVRYAVAGSGEFAVGLGDLDGDGRPDLAVAFNGLTVLRNNGDGTFGREATYATRHDPTAIAMGDLNGDGKLDVVTVGSASLPFSIMRESSFSVLLNSGLICPWR